MFDFACHRFHVLVIGLLISVPLTADKPNDRPFWRPVLMGTNGMVAAEHPLECRAAIKALEAGGNAIDAAVASFYMTTVVEQHQAGIGGDGFILAYIAKEDRVIFINGTGPAPKLATAEFYRKLGKIPNAGPYSTDVPGMAGGFDLALKKYGTMSYKKLLEPVIEAAGKGHPLSFWASSYHRKTIPKLSPFPSSVKTLLKNGGPFEPGDLFVQKDLANTLETIANEGAEAFYRGRLARLSADFYKKQKGLLRYEDLASYEPEEAEPIKTTYADLEVYQSAPNSQGIVMLMALNILEGFALDKMGHNSPEYIHVVTEALKLAFADRNKYIADPRFAKDMPVESLLSKAYAKQRRSLIRMDKTLAPPPPPGDPRNHKAVLGDSDVNYANSQQAALEKSYENTDGETSSFSIADRFGNLVSVTHSVNGTFGSGMIVEGGGYVLNNRMPYFSLAEDDVNFLVPGKRTRHTVNPALALKNGRPYLAWNTPGGDNQPQAMLQAFLNVVVFDMNIQQAVEAPTVTSFGFKASMYPQPVKGTLAMPRVLANEVGERVSKLGHRTEVIEMQQPYQQQPSGAGAVKMVMIDSERGVLMGGVSPAKDDYVMGW
ncbi:MAG: gamma-glutamyltransferase [Bryobacterales bacterium]|nr:gamma-glutamyltransferase [Bryobacterales bacterium]MDE0292664.1 gamma-glutamyltransferase [Bryobacterales bacterium]